ncbi:uncharacterized protein MYCGRDRAFT_43351 [Zymoseptoria tritici IPO323]|uniref:Haloacid dehalogenase n=1 Tax=Zymoseptoria tritici (strain CBS 115943 / IPO323) TaxID=336722 RepID=F9XD42_ZYMTI|nr:uncharacterized protein MYCGRDRAFT_43351 [Zymoseptoria tritici IPO323]EGP86856.1 hypothetical protein MYCGRDRAFT_43351 [Zymoseptoria tritici IPO323]
MTTAFRDPQPKGLFFDVFGTCVDWRKTVTDTLYKSAKEALDSSSSISSDVRSRASAMTYEQWGEIAQEWRNTYYAFTRAIANDASLRYKTVDQHHLEALQEILSNRGLVTSDSTGSLWNEEKVLQLSLVWHYLDPWSDTVQGLAMLNKKFTTATLSNGNVALLEDMKAHAKMPFTHIYSSEMFQSYKPSPKVYLGAAEKMGLKPEECMMVAAHLDDLKHAKSNGFWTLYVERPREERNPEWLAEEAKGWVDVWVKMEEDGFVAAAEKLGIEK